MTVLFAPANSANTLWQSPSLTSDSKRKRSSCSVDASAVESLSWRPLTLSNAMEHDGGDDLHVDSQLEADGRVKRTRTVSDALGTDSRSLPSSSANVPFSTEFRNSAATPRRPPTVEEQQSWASSSTQPSSSPPSGVYASSLPKTSTAATSAWTKVTTDYGHGWERSEEQTLSTCEGATSSSLWQHVEEDADMDLFDSDTSRRGDTFSWDDGILQLKVPVQAHPHPYMPISYPHAERAQMGATYFA